MAGYVSIGIFIFKKMNTTVFSLLLICKFQRVTLIHSNSLILSKWRVKWYNLKFNVRENRTGLAAITAIIDINVITVIIITFHEYAQTWREAGGVWGVLTPNESVQNPWRVLAGQISTSFAQRKKPQELCCNAIHFNSSTHPLRD